MGVLFQPILVYNSINCKSGGGREGGGRGREVGRREGEGGREGGGRGREGGRRARRRKKGGGRVGGRTIDADLFCMSNNSDQASLPYLSCSIAQGGHS